MSRDEKNPKLPPDVVERLRASKDRADQAVVDAGYETGRTWAMHSAEFDQLQRLSAAQICRQDAGLDWTVDGLLRAVATEAEWDERSRDMPHDLLGLDELVDDECDGFVEGALDVLEQVEADMVG